MSADPIAELSLSDFAGYVGQALEIDFGAGGVPATITDVRAVGGYTKRPSGGFSVTLRAAAPAPLQGTFPLKHPTLGTLGLFMTPRRLVGAEIEYEFILN